MKIELEAPGGIPGDEMMVAIRESFSVQDWTRILVNVDGESFLLGELGAPRRMMHRLLDLKDGGTVSLLIPKNVEFDLEATRTRLEATLTAFDRGVEASRGKVEGQGKRDVVRSIVNRLSAALRVSVIDSCDLSDILGFEVEIGRSIVGSFVVNPQNGSGSEEFKQALDKSGVAREKLKFVEEDESGGVSRLGFREIGDFERFLHALMN